MNLRTPSTLLFCGSLLLVACSDDPTPGTKARDTSNDPSSDDDDDDGDDDGDGDEIADAGKSSGASSGKDASSGSTRMDAAATVTARDAGKDAAQSERGDEANSESDSGASSDAGLSSIDASRPSGGFASVPNAGEKGPFTSKTVANTGPSGGFTVFQPTELAANGAQNPIVAWGNGGFTTPDLYPMLPHLATHGFVVIASNNPFVTPEDVQSGVDWIAKQNDDSASPFFGKLDTKNISGVGYSLGGLATYGIAPDPRVVTIAIISGASTSEATRTENMPKLRTPTAYFCTDDDQSKGNCAGDYAVIKVPSFFGVVKGTDHFAVVTNDAAIQQLTRATTAWLRWHQMDDQAHKPAFVGSDCGLCTDSAWSVQPQKNLQ